MIKRIFRSIILGSVVSFLCSLALFLLVLYRYVHPYFMDEIADEVWYIRTGIELNGTAYLEKLETDSTVVWISMDGSTLFGPEIEHQDAARALEVGENADIWYSDNTGVQTVNCAVRLTDGSVLYISEAENGVWIIIRNMLGPMLIIFSLLLLLSIALSIALSRKIVRPIHNIDIENPDIHADYAELSPLLQRINRQNKLIQRQMNDLRSRQKEFLTITENMSEGLILIDNKTEVLSYNSSAKAQLDAGDITYGKSVLEISSDKEFAGAVHSALAGERSAPVLESGGRIYQLFANPVAVGGTVSGAVLLILDVTEREQRDAMRREFTSNVSHELKTPLTSIYGISEIMMNGIVKPQDMEGFAKNIHDESGRLITLIEDILRLSQLDEGTQESQQEDTDLYNIAQEVVGRLLRVAEKCGVVLTISGESAPMRGIPSILSEMVYNLCDNGIKYNKAGGMVQVDVSHRDGHVVLTVQDTGIGIPPEHQDRVFERFYRVDKSHSKAIGGTGLGLSIVKHGAAYHGAQVSLFSKEGEGTTVQIRF